MNIFIVFLIGIFMVGFYLLSSPSQYIAANTTENAVAAADLRSVAQCTAAVQNAAINDRQFDDPCVQRSDIKNEFICLNANLTVTKCEIVRNKKPAYSYFVTATAPLDPEKYNDMLDIMERYYPDAGTFGLYYDGQIISGGTSSKRTVPKGVISSMNLENGQLVYLTQYEMPDVDTEYTVPTGADIVCPAGTAKTYRFSRWQCVGYNDKTNCAGDMIWDSELLACVADESRKPLCAPQQTAVLVDSVWECINPFPDKVCPANMIARLNYNTLEWECVEDPNATQTVKKCDNVMGGAIYDAVGATLRVPVTSSCTDCEIMLTDPETCATACVPDPSRLNDSKCYPSANSCSGASRAFYFGFPDRAYAAQVSAIDPRAVPFDAAHSQNRKFNCLDCGDRGIDDAKSFPPYIAVCK